jgi:8-oxo-dGTP pyrophosphatase MutT (NUDIX family)
MSNEEKQRYSMVPRTWCLIFNKWKILLIQYWDSKWDRAGWYNWIGWHVEKWEGIIENAKREIFEETGLRPNTVLKWVIHASNFFWWEFINYITVSQSDTDQVSSNNEWTLHRVDISKIWDYKIFTDVKIVLEHITKLEKHEIFTAKSVFNGWSTMIDFIIE